MATEHIEDETAFNSMKETQNAPGITTELISKYEHKFDPIYIKREYFKKLRKINKKYGNIICFKHWNEMFLQEFIESTKSLHFRKQLIFGVIQENGEDILTIKGSNNINDSIIKVLSAEECFPVILKAHKESMHGDAEAITRITENHYSYPVFCIPLVLQSCNVCKEVSNFHNVQECKEMPSSKSIWNFAIHKMHKNKKFHYIFVYMEVVTSFVIIRPLVKLCLEELGMELMKIFSTFGPPKEILTSKDYEEFLMKTLKLLAVVNPSYTIPIGRYNDYLFDVSNVIEELKKWLIETDCKDWVIGCRIVQWKFNTSLRVISQKNGNWEIKTGVPYNLFFGNEANAFNHVSSNMVSEQLSPKSRNRIILEVFSNTCNTKVVRQIVDLNEDVSDDDSADTDIVLCGVCGEEFVIYTCVKCNKPLHYKCGSRMQIVENKNFVTKLICAGCTINAD